MYMRVLYLQAHVNCRRVLAYCPALRNGLGLWVAVFAFVSPIMAYIASQQFFTKLAVIVTLLGVTTIS
jgi:hypothetical protein